MCIKKRACKTRQINQLGCPWQRYNCQLFKFQILMLVWLTKVKNTQLHLKPVD